MDMDLDNFSRQRWEQRRKSGSDGQDNYKNSDDDYFCWRWCRRQFSLDHESYTIPSDDQILQSVLNNEYFYRFHVDYLYFASDRVTAWPLADRLLELYGDDPISLSAMWDWAKSSGAVNEGTLDVSGSPMNPPSMHAFHQRLTQDAATIGFTPLTHQTFITPSSGSSGRLSRGRGSFQSRFALSLSVFLNGRYFEILESLVKERVQGLKLSEFNKRDLSFLETAGYSSPNHDAVSDFSIVFAVAGSGKTQHLFNHLHQTWGHYLVSGRISGIENSPDSFLSARRGLASQDTSYLCGMLGQNKNVNVYAQGLGTLLDNREKTLQYFRNLSNDFLPCHWLLFQAVCTRNFDPFLETFKIALIRVHLMGEESLEPLHHSAEIFCFDEVQCEMNFEQTLRNEEQPLDAFLSAYVSFYITNHARLMLSGTSLQLTECIQRVQEKLNFWKPNESSSRRLRLVQDRPEIIDRFCLVSTNEDFHQRMHNHIKRLIEQASYLTTLESDIVEHYELWEALIIDTRVASKEQLYRILKFILQHLGGGSLSAPDEVAYLFCSMIGCCPTSHGVVPIVNILIEQASAEFRGRLRWSIRFIEHVFAELLRQMSVIIEEWINSGHTQPQTGEHSIHLVAGYLRDEREKILTEQWRAVQEEIKMQLKHRINTLAKNGHHYLLQDLYATAVRADLMHKPCIFRTMESAQMVTQGFALLQSSGQDATSLKQELAEPLAVDAVIEYLNEPCHEEEHRYEKYLQEVLYHNQDDGSMFGKAAEYYIGWTFGGLFFQQENIIQLSPNRRRHFLQTLSDADLIPRFSQASTTVNHKIGSLDDYMLEKPSSLVADDIVLGKQISLHQWLDRVLLAQFFPIFYFPSNAAGPDIVFCLRHRISRQRILCGIQIKTGITSCPPKDSFKLIRTIDPNLWFSKYIWKRKDLVEALQRHGSQLRIMTVLAVTSLTSEEYFSHKTILREGLKSLQGLVQTWSPLHANKAKLTAEYNALSKTQKKIPNLILKTAKQEETNALKRIVDMANVIPRTGSGNPSLRDELDDRVTAFSGNGVFDFYFTVLDKDQMWIILGHAFQELTKAVKAIEVGENSSDEE